MKRLVLLCLLLPAGTLHAGAQQRDTTLNCGFSRIKFPLVSPPRAWFHPVQAVVTLPATLRSSPISIASEAGRIDTPATIYLISDEPSGSYYQAINFKTGIPVWIPVEAVSITEAVPLDSTTASPNFDGPLKVIGRLSTGKKGLQTQSALRIVNHYPFALTLLVERKAYTVPAAKAGKWGTKNVVLKSGAQGYVISVPAGYLTVFFGWGNFGAGNQYQYRVDIESIE